MSQAAVRERATLQAKEACENGQASTNEHHQIVIVGGGTAGITVAARLRRALRSSDVAIIEPSGKHYYQPLWTLVGGGEAKRESTERSEATLIPRGAKWLQDAVTEFLPEENRVITRDGRRVSYDFLVVAAGIQIDWDRVKGLREAVGKNGVCSNYSYETVESTWENIRNFRGGTAIFTQPPAPFKCGGAPQKIAYLADDYWRKSGVRGKTRLIFASAGASIFPVPHYAPAMEAVVKRKRIETLFQHELVEIWGERKEAAFRRLDTGESILIPYDLLHVTPPQSAPDFLKRSPLADPGGWVEVDPATLRHPRYPNIFALGDCSSLPTSKTGAAIRKQAPVLVRNLISVIQGQPLTAQYQGYTSCPLVTGYGKLVMAEFDYDKQPEESFPIDQRKELWAMYMVKKHLLPQIYWHGMLKGRL